MRRWLPLVTLAGLVGSIAYYRLRHVNPFRPRLERIELSLPPGAEELDGLRIGFVTDTHVGPFTSASDIRRGLALFDSEPLELSCWVAITSPSRTFMRPRWRMPSRSRPRWRSWEPSRLWAIMTCRWASIAFALSSNVQEFECFATSMRSSSGTAHAWLSSESTTPSSATPILPAHSRVCQQACRHWHSGTKPISPRKPPGAAPWLSSLDIHTAARSGSPESAAIWLPPDGRRRDMGFFDAKGMPVYISRGLGVYRPPVRFRCPPEVTLVTLRAASAHPAMR